MPSPANFVVGTCCNYKVLIIEGKSPICIRNTVTEQKDVTVTRLSSFFYSRKGILFSPLRCMECDCDRNPEAYDHMKINVEK